MGHLLKEINHLRRKVFATTVLGCLSLKFSGDVLSQTLPNLRPLARDGRPWRIAYIETRPFANYAATLHSLINSLYAMGWLSTNTNLPYIKGQTDTKVIWKWLTSLNNEKYLKFYEEDFFTFESIKGDAVNDKSKEIISRLNQQNQIDLVLVMGTEAAQRIAVTDHSTPVVAMSISNAVQAEIVKGANLSGIKHIWAHMDPYRYKRQIDIFYDIFKFKKLGVVFDDDQAGRSFSAIDDILDVARSKNFKVITENVHQPQKYGADMGKFSRDLRNAYSRLSEKVDAAYIGLYIGSNPADLAYAIEPLIEKKIPVFAQQSNDVNNGALMSLARLNFSGVGGFNARAVVRILKGEQPGNIPQVYENSPNIILNLDVAKKIGYKPKFELLLGADEIIKEK